MDTFQLPVTDDLCIGVIDLQGSEQGDESCTLCWGTSVFCTSFLVKTTFVADADRMGVVMPGMSADLFFRASDVELTITGNVVVVATAIPAFSAVYVVEQLKRQMLVRPRCRTVNYYQIYSSHN